MPGGYRQGGYWVYSRETFISHHPIVTINHPMIDTRVSASPDPSRRPEMHRLSTCAQPMGPRDPLNPEEKAMERRGRRSLVAQRRWLRAEIGETSVSPFRLRAGWPAATDQPPSKAIRPGPEPNTSPLMTSRRFITHQIAVLSGSPSRILASHGPALTPGLWPIVSLRSRKGAFARGPR